MPQGDDALSQLPDDLLHSKLLQLDEVPESTTEKKEAWNAKDKLKLLKTLVASKKKREEQDEKRKVKLLKDRDVALQREQVAAAAADSTNKEQVEEIEGQYQGIKQAMTSADPEPPADEAVLQPAQVPASPDLNTIQLPECLMQLATYSAAATAAGPTSSSQSSEPTQKVIIKSLLVSGQLGEFLTSLSGWTTPICRALFELMAYSSNEFLALAAHRVLLQGICDLDFTAIGAVESAYTGGVHRARRTCMLEWLPGARDFLSVLEAYGYPTSQGRAGRGPRGAPKGHPSGSTAQQQQQPRSTEWLSSRLVNLQLVLRTLSVLCELDAAKQLTTSLDLTGSAVQPLVVALVHMHLDERFGNSLLPDLQRAVEALMNAIEERSWGRLCVDIASQVAELGPSHRAHLRAVLSIPHLHPHGCMLKQQAALALMRKLLGVKGNAPRAGTVNLAEVAALLGSDANVFELERKLTKDKRMDNWLLHTLMKLADAVLWPEVQRLEAGQQNEDLRGMVQWLSAFLKAISRSVRGMSLSANETKRLIADLQNSYMFACPDDWTNA